MPRQDLIWTALPNGVKAGGLLGGQTVRLSVLVSPRLGIGEPGGLLSLTEFPDFEDWPRTLRERLRAIAVTFENGPEVRAEPKRPPGQSSLLWKLLFPETTAVIPYGFEFGDLDDVEVVSPPAPTVADVLKSLYVRAATEEGLGAGRDLPTPLALGQDPVVQSLGASPGSGPGPGPWPPPGSGPGPGPGKWPPEGPPPGADPGDGGPSGGDGGIDVDIDINIDVGLLGIDLDVDVDLGSGVGLGAGLGVGLRGKEASAAEQGQAATAGVEPLAEQPGGSRAVERGGERPPDAGDTVVPKEGGTAERRGPDVPKGSVPRRLSQPPTLEQTRDVCGRVAGMWKREPNEEHPAPADDPAQRIDFHRTVSLLGDHPELMRQLGLVLDLEVKLPPGLPLVGGVPESSTVRVRPIWSTRPERPTTHHSPQTAYELGEKLFAARPREERPEVRDGLLRLGEPGRFRVEQFDVDGGDRKVVNLAHTLDRYRELIRAQQTFDLPEGTGLPALRTTGLSVLHEDVLEGVDIVNLAGLGLFGFLQGAGALFEQLVGAPPATDEDEDPPPGPPVGPLFAEDLVAGYRVDAFDAKTKTWRSLCQQRTVYEFQPPEPPSTGDPAAKVTIAGREGYVELAVTGSPKRLRVPASLFTWEGWSLTAPRPGKVLGPEGQSAVDRTNDPGPDVKFRVISSPTDRSLPRLRFGRTYWLRARAVDLAGNSLPFHPAGSAPPEAVTAPVAYARFEPVPAPAVVLTALPVEGESVERLVVRSDPAPAAPHLPPIAGSTRHVLPPKSSQLLAELHGRFDDGAGGTVNAAAYTRATREKGSIDDLGSKEKLANGDEFTVVPDKPVKVPYLPDPAARGALLLSVPDRSFVRVPFAGAWPDAQPFRLRLVGVPHGSPPKPPSFDAAQRVLSFPLPQGETATVRLSSYIVPDPADATTAPQKLKPVSQADLDLLRHMGVWQWTESSVINEQEQQEQRERAKLGANWLLMPYRTFELVHAAQRPVERPALRSRPAVQREAFGDTHAVVNAAVRVHADSTAKVDLMASWVDPVDDGDPAKDPLKGPHPTREAQLGEQPVGNEPELDVRANHEFADTKHHQVSYRVVGASRFREYFPQKDAQGDPIPAEAFSRASTEAGPDFEVDVLASARPAVPKPRYVIPTFAWTRDARRKAGSDVVFTSTRQGRGLRVWLDRPWWSSGAGELLGVVFVPGPPLPPEDARAPFVTTWGQDPTWTTSQSPDDSLTAEAFVGATVEHGLTLEELQGGPDGASGGERVSVAAYALDYDGDRNMLSCDIAFDAAWARLHYFPFVRLALARYQQSAMVQGGRDMKLSRVVVLDPVQLTPDRTLTVRALPPQDGKLRRHVAVTGHRPTAPGKGLHSVSGGTRMSLRVLRSTLTGSNLGWDQELGSVDVVLPWDATSARWEGEVAFPPAATHVERRLVVQEVEFRPFDTGYKA